MIKWILDKLLCSLVFILGCVIVYVTWTYYPSTPPYTWIADNFIFSAVFKFFFLIITMLGFALIFAAAFCLDDKKKDKDEQVSHNDGEFDSFD